MILHTIIVRGSLIIAEFSEAEEDYSTIIKKRIPEVKNEFGNQKILKDDIYLYAILFKDLKFLCISKDDNEEIMNKLQLVVNETDKIIPDGNYSVQLTQLLHKLLGQKPQNIENNNIQQTIITTPFEKFIKQPKKKDFIDFQKKLCVMVITIVLIIEQFIAYQNQLEKHICILENLLFKQMDNDLCESILSHAQRIISSVSNLNGSLNENGQMQFNQNSQSTSSISSLTYIMATLFAFYILLSLFSPSRQQNILKGDRQQQQFPNPDDE